MLPELHVVRLVTCWNLPDQIDSKPVAEGETALRSPRNDGLINGIDDDLEVLVRQGVLVDVLQVDGLQIYE